MFVFAGDNIYADTTDENLLIEAYDQLGMSKQYKMLRDVVPIVAIWDDHDYGINDGVLEHPSKRMSKRVFLDFREQKHSARRDRRYLHILHFRSVRQKIEFNAA